MLKVKYNPWLDEYKTPFGAVLIDSKVSFSINVEAPHVENVTLVLIRDNEEQEKILMRRSAGNRFHADFQTEHTKGIYFYWFQVTQLEDDLHKLFFVGRKKEDITPAVSDSRDCVIPYQLTCYEEKDVAPEWYRKGICYQIFPDRFFNAQPDGMPLARKKNSFLYMDTTDTPYYIKDSEGNVVRWDFYGGNLQGILEKIEYLKDLGVDTIYLNPIFEACSNHRYDTADYMHVDPMLGSDDFFKIFLDKLHEEGFHVILDGVFNHVGKNSRYFNMDNSYDSIGAYESTHSPYYSWFNFTHFPDEYASWWGVKDLPEVNKDDPSYQEFIYGGKDSVIDKWTALGADGWRLDVADELPDYFIEGIRQRLDNYPNRVLIGEVWEDASNKISYDQRRQYILGNSLYGVMNYPVKNGIIQLVNQEKQPQLIAEELMTLRENYPKNIFFNNLNNLGTHDTERIFTLLDEDMDKLKLAVAMLFCMPGIPCVYYGDEAGLTGGKDPDNRRFYPWGEENQEVMEVYREWIQLRKSDETLTEGELYLGYTDQLFVIVRGEETDFSALCLNISDETALLEWKTLHFSRPLPPLIQKKLDNELEQSVAAQNYYYEHFSIKQAEKRLREKNKV